MDESVFCGKIYKNQYTQSYRIRLSLGTIPLAKYDASVSKQKISLPKYCDVLKHRESQFSLWNGRQKRKAGSVLKFLTILYGRNVRGKRLTDARMQNCTVQFHILNSTLSYTHKYTLILRPIRILCRLFIYFKRRKREIV